jgi:RNA polymerase sigma-B factor
VSAAEDHARFRRYRRERDPALRDALVERYLPLARSLARRYHSGSERDDVLQVASLALLKAVDRFDPDNGAAFTSYATPTILGEIKRYFRDHGWAVRVPRELQELSIRIERVREDLTGRLGRSPTPKELAGELDVGLERVLEALAADTAHHPIALDQPGREGDDEPPRVIAKVEEPGFAAVDDGVEVASLLDCLPERDRIAVELRFRGDLLQHEIAELLGISQMQVSRIISRALVTMREHAERGELALDLRYDVTYQQ